MPVPPTYTDVSDEDVSNIRIGSALLSMLYWSLLKPRANLGQRMRPFAASNQMRKNTEKGTKVLNIAIRACKMMETLSVVYNFCH